MPPTIEKEQVIVAQETVIKPASGNLVIDPITGETLLDQYGLNIELTQPWAAEKIGSDLVNFDSFMDETAAQAEAATTNTEKSDIANGFGGRMRDKLSQLSTLYVDPERIAKCGAVTDKLAEKMGLTSEQFMEKHLSVWLATGKSPDGKMTYEHFEPKTIEDFFAAKRLQTYQDMLSGDDMLIHASIHREAIIKTGNLRPKAKHEPGRVHLNTGILSPALRRLAPADHTSANRSIQAYGDELAMGQHSLFVHFGEHAADSSEVLSAFGYGNTKFLFSRATIMEHSPVRMSGPVEASQDTNGPTYAEVEISDETLENASENIKSNIGIGSMIEEDVSFAASSASAEAAVDFEYPIEEAVMVMGRGEAQNVVQKYLEENEPLPGWPANMGEAVKQTGSSALSEWATNMCGRALKHEELPEGASELGKKVLAHLNELLKNPDTDPNDLFGEAIGILAKDILVASGASEAVVGLVVQSGNTIPQQALDKLKQKSVPDGKRKFFVRASSDSDKLGFTQKEVLDLVPW